MIKRYFIVWFEKHLTLSFLELQKAINSLKKKKVRSVLACQYLFKYIQLLEYIYIVVPFHFVNAKT